jgi:hypothetical protein
MHEARFARWRQRVGFSTYLDLGIVAFKPASINWRIASETLGIGRCLARHFSIASSMFVLKPIIFFVTDARCPRPRINFVNSMPPMPDPRPRAYWSLNSRGSISPYSNTPEA